MHVLISSVPVYMLRVCCNNAYVYAPPGSKFPISISTRTRIPCKQGKSHSNPMQRKRRRQRSYNTF